MMTSLGLNALILYILFKTPFCNLILGKLPPYLRSMKSFKQLRESVLGFAWKSSRVTRRMSVVVLFLAGLWLIKKIWDRIKGNEIISNLIERYLCDSKVMGITMGKDGLRMKEVDRKRYVSYLKRGKI